MAHLNEILAERYVYLFQNKELILALCIRKIVPKEKIKRNICNLKKLRNECKYGDKTTLEMLDFLIKDREKQLDIEKYYLVKSVSEQIVDLFIEFLFTDKSIWETALFKHVEGVKNNSLYLDAFLDMIEALEKRRSSNKLLKEMPTFTVWKILNYVRNKYVANDSVLRALDKYYNIDRYVLVEKNSVSGYILNDSEIDEVDYPSLVPRVRFEMDTPIEIYKGNSYEEEDNYYISLDFENNCRKSDTRILSCFQEELAYSLMPDEELKKEIIKQIGGYKKILINNCK